MTEFELTPELPHIVIPAPECGHCGTEVEMDGDAAWCEGCRISWDRIDEAADGHPDPDAEGSDVPCEIVPPPSVASTMTLVYGACILPSGHEGEHLTPMRRDQLETR